MLLYFYLKYPPVYVIGLSHCWVWFLLLCCQSHSHLALYWYLRSFVFGLLVLKSVKLLWDIFYCRSDMSNFNWSLIMNSNNVDIWWMQILCVNKILQHPTVQCYFTFWLLSCASIQQILHYSLLLSSGKIHVQLLLK